jgi:hypothetical protein
MSCWGNIGIGRNKKIGMSIPFLLEAIDYIEAIGNSAITSSTIKILIVCDRTREKHIKFNHAWGFELATQPSDPDRYLG